MSMAKRLVGLVVVAVMVAACGGDDGGGDVPTTEATGDGGAAVPDPLILGLVPSQELDQLVEDADLLGDLLGAELGVDVETFVPDSYAALVVAMSTEQAHVGMFGPIALVQAVDQAGAEVTLQSVRRDSPSYHTQWLTNDPDRFCATDVVVAPNPEGNEVAYCNGTDSADAGPVGEDALNELEPGETIFFVDESSASGYYYPATQIQTVTGMDPLTDIDAQFAGGHPNAVQAVARGDAAVGVSFDDARNELFAELPTVGTDVVVFAWSEEIPNDGVAISGDLSAEAKDAITEAMVTVSETPDGAQALFDVYGAEGLVEADLEALEVARQVAANFGE